MAATTDLSIETNQAAALAFAIDELRSYNGIAILGAGISCDAGIPLTMPLVPVVWQTLDENPGVRSIVAEALGIADGPAKGLFLDDWNRMKIAFDRIPRDRPARLTFQRIFIALNKKRTTKASPAHDALAKLVHVGIIEYVISLNWDSLLEVAYSNRYGTSINSNFTRFTKPHGDVYDPESDWTLPHESGSIPNELVNRIESFVHERPRVLLVIGYSEQDDVVVKKLVKPLDERWRVIRIGPQAVGDNAIRMSAQDALTAISDALCPEPEVPGWNYVTFANQRDIASAIKGERLGPADVESCPRLPQTNLVCRDLGLLHHSVITGPPGCGKSITAFQAANDFRKRGWQVLILNHSDVSENEALKEAKQAPAKKLLFVDDGQTVTEAFRKALIELADEDAKVLIAYTDHEGDNSHSTHISNLVAVETLTQAYLQRRDEIQRIVSKFDNDIGSRYLDVPIESRIDEAGKTETTWQFNFVLRGGWRTAGIELKLLRERYRADLLLLIISVLQITRLDASIDREALYHAASILQRDRRWAENALSVLWDRQDILSNDQLRCPHIKFASVVVAHWFAKKQDPEFVRTVEMIKATLMDTATPLRGLSWLLSELKSTGTFRQASDRALFLAKDWDKLVARCLDTNGSVERRDGALALAHLIDWKADCCDCFASKAPQLSRWLDNVDNDCAYSFGSLINSILTAKGGQNGGSTAALAIVRGAVPERIASQIKSAAHSAAYGWGFFLCAVYKAADPDWRNRFFEALDKEHLLRFSSDFDFTQLAHVNEFIFGLSCFDVEFGFQALDHALPVIKSGLQQDPLNSWERLRELLWFLLGEPPEFLRQRNPNRRQRKHSRMIAAFLPSDKVAADLSNSRQRDFERYSFMLGWLKQVYRSRYREIIRAIDLDRLTIVSAGLWQKPPRELRLLISLLSEDDDHEPARSWVAAHKDEIYDMDPITACVAPEIAVYVLKRGRRVTLSRHNSRDWELQGLALASIAAVDNDQAKCVAANNEAHLATCVSRLEWIDCDNNLSFYLDVLKGLDNASLTRSLHLVNLAEADKYWKGMLKGKSMKSKKMLAKLVSISMECGDPLGKFAQVLNRKLPKSLRVAVSNTKRDIED
ncbi:MAG: hypothetical protein V1897_08995 [Pseudomonadota bacterium]